MSVAAVQISSGAFTLRQEGVAGAGAQQHQQQRPSPFQNNSLNFSVTLLQATPDPRSHRIHDQREPDGTSGPCGRHSRDCAGSGSIAG